jgi:hypothetical protein
MELVGKLEIIGLLVAELVVLVGVLLVIFELVD